jgi:hypothetical protein
MSKETELLRRALDYIDRNYDRGLQLYEEIEVFLSNPSDDAEEPVAQVSMTNSSKAYVTAPNIPPGTLLYRHPPRPEPARKLLPEKIDPILRTVGSMRYSPNYVAGWNNCIDAMSNGAEARKPMTKEEIYEEFGEWDTDFMKGVISGIRYAEKHHRIPGE